uniref:Nuclear receptor domain-containing protein n=1 Tax=Caenorhabditis tropicalis TaxID=1561998 RepID=A0A1I7T6N6_9PELO
MDSESTFRLVNCLVCDQKADGKRHYGAVVCRACAAFFRRSITFKSVKKCRGNGKCDFLKKGFFTCKHCRLQKCRNAGMSEESFQFERDIYSNRIQVATQIPITVDLFYGKSNLIIFRAPTQSSQIPKPFLDLEPLFDKVQKILFQGPETPIQSDTKLGKLAMRLHPILKSSNKVNPNSKVYGKEESLAQLEYDILTVTKWLTYFDDFQRLPPCLQVQMLQGIWSVWWTLTRLANTAICIRQKIDEEEIRKMKLGQLLYVCDQEIDMSWLSTYSVEELKFFIDIKTEYRMDELTRLMLDLDPSDVELSFMLGQLCFHYVGKRFQGEILQVADKFQEIMADDLHDYYNDQMKRPNYSKRLASMMKINNMIQSDLLKSREKTELALVFDIFCIEVSHPGMFIDS